MKYLILLLALNACTTQNLDQDARRELAIENHVELYGSACDQELLNEQAEMIGAYEITCEELDAL